MGRTLPLPLRPRRPRRQLLSRKIAHTVDGLTILVEVIASLTGSVRIAIERAEGLLVEHLQQHCSAEIYCVSPKISARARERYRMAAAKSDEFDAYVLADTLRHQYAQWRRWLLRRRYWPS
ncbi:transposase [Mycobacterium rufum]|uniref:Transposase n=1 Tax=Mycolicibacterium rufum TaxID=318424 RepID=A0A9X2Y9A0_9MYCO|nr:transposase [Mycolicibacterium rufum]